MSDFFIEEMMARCCIIVFAAGPALIQSQPNVSRALVLEFLEVVQTWKSHARINIAPWLTRRQSCFNAGPTSSTLAQRWSNFGPKLGLILVATPVHAQTTTLILLPDYQTFHLSNISTMSSFLSSFAGVLNPIQLIRTLS